MIKRSVPALLIVLCSVLIAGGPASAEDALYGDIYGRYPRTAYVIGIGETQSTGSALRDRRVAEVMARRELASQMRVEVSEVAIDIACSGGAAEVTGSGDACRDEFTSVLETRVDEFIQGSRIVEHGEYEGRVYAVAVIEKSGAARELGNEADKAAALARDEVQRAKAGEPGAGQRAREEYLRAHALAAQAEALGGVRGKAGTLLAELEEEIPKLGGQ